MSGDENMPPPGPEQPSATKKAKDLLVELVEHVGPPRECPIKLKEWPWPNPIEMNWIAICGDLEEEKRLLYLEEVGRMRKATPQVDWSDAKSDEGSRRVVQWPQDFKTT